METEEFVVGIEGREVVKVKRVEPLEGYKLRVELSNGRKGTFDASRFVRRGGIFRELEDPKYFRQVSVQHGAVTWPHAQDIDPELIDEELQPEPSGN